MNLSKKLMVKNAGAIVTCDTQDICYSSLVAMVDLLKHGCTTVFDRQYCFPRAAGKDLLDRQFKAANLFWVDISRLEPAGALHDPASHIARTGITGPVMLTMVGGPVVWADEACTAAIRARSPAYGR